MKTLLIGFDSAWTLHNQGAIVACLKTREGQLLDLGPPRAVKFAEAEEYIGELQLRQEPDETLILLDQPTVVTNAVGQRPVENLVASPVSKMGGGVQPSNTGRADMFGSGAPLWRFLDRFGGPADPFQSCSFSGVIETYPVLALIALGWTRPSVSGGQKLPKYNPARKKTFSLEDWRYLCTLLSKSMAERGLLHTANWLDEVRDLSRPRKQDQDGVDACACLLTALYMLERKKCLLVGERASGYMVVPFGEHIHRLLEDRCYQTGRKPDEWLRAIFWGPGNDRA